jgi:hypothetical protein
MCSGLAKREVAVISRILVDLPVISDLCFECEYCWCWQEDEPVDEGCVCVLILPFFVECQAA